MARNMYTIHSVTKEYDESQGNKETQALSTENCLRQTQQKKRENNKRRRKQRRRQEEADVKKKIG